MADVSKIQINGLEYNVKDAEARRLIEEFTAEDWTFTLEDGSTITKTVIVK